MTPAPTLKSKVVFGGIALLKIAAIIGGIALTMYSDNRAWLVVSAAAFIAAMAG